MTWTGRWSNPEYAPKETPGYTFKVKILRKGDSYPKGGAWRGWDLDQADNANAQCAEFNAGKISGYWKVYNPEDVVLYDELVLIYSGPDSNELGEIHP